MRKKFAILLTFVLAFVVALGVLAGCNKEKEGVTVDILRTTLNLETGKSFTLTATASDGSEIVWSTSSEAVATVNENGKVTGVSAGKATVTAKVKDGEASASCEVTVKDPIKFTFKNDAGDVITEATVDRNIGPVQLSAEASDGGAIINWTSSDEKIATVSDKGLVTGLHEGEANITAITANASATIKVTVIDSFDGVHYDIKTAGETEAGNWYYHSNSTKGQVININQAEVRGEKITFDYDGNCNWDVGDVFIAVNNADISEGWHKLNMTINSDVVTSITVNGTRVNLIEGDNTVSVAYEQKEGAAAAHIILGNSDAQTTPKDIRLVINNVTWADFTPVDLAVPSFTLDADNNVAITDETNTEGVKQYEIGLFTEEGTLVHRQPLLSKNGKLDTEAVETNGEFIVKIRAIGNLGYNDSDWSDGNDITIKIENTNISYDLNPGPDQNRGAGAATAVTSGKWEYYAVVEEGAVCSSAKFSDGTVTFKGSNGWSWYSLQLFRHYAQFDAGATLQITLTIEADKSGKVTIGGEVVELTEGEAKTVTVYVTQPSDTSTPTLTIVLAVIKSGQTPTEDSLPTYTEMTVKVSNVQVNEFTPEQLKAPSISVEGKEIIITDTNEEGRVNGYEVGFFTEAGGETPVKIATIKTAEELKATKVDAGNYTLKIRALPASVLYSKSDWSENGATFSPESLSAPTLAVEEKVVTIIDTNNEEANVGGYQLGWFLADSDTPKYTMNLANGATIDDGKVEAGSYTLKLKALSSGLWYCASEWSEGVAYEKTGGIVMNTYEASYETVKNEGETEGGSNDKDYWKLWWVQDAGWNCGDVVNLTHNIDKDTKTLEITYSGGSTTWCTQLFYKNSNLEEGKNYKVTLNINVSAACKVSINGNEKSLTAGDNAIEFVWAAKGTSFSMQMGQSASDITLKIANVAWTEVE